MSSSKDRFAVEQGQVVVTRDGKQIAGPKRRPKKPRK